ncbi:unnamed protein product [Owenia fusiformis]|uniref:Hexosyltransferase n=1 Tax=Owenia fusiformis TaxID=6347 RepID=A0A8J1UP67_OWEFU|nr:unnamed protein product [Owenia fusiformis]
MMARKPKVAIKRMLQFLVVVGICVSFTIYLALIPEPHNYVCKSTCNEVHFPVYKSPPACAKTENVYLVTVVHSEAWNIKQRLAVRHTWGSTHQLGDKNIKLIFVLEKPRNYTLNTLVEAENNRYADMLLVGGGYTTSIGVIKSLMSLRWILNNCKEARFVLRTNDNSFVNYYKILALIKTPGRRSNMKYIAGRVISGLDTNRFPNSVDFVPLKLFAGKKYPDFVDGSSGYIMPVKVMQSIMGIVDKIKSLPREDVYLTGLCRTELSRVRLAHLSSFLPNTQKLSDAMIITTAMTAQPIGTKQMELLWRQLKENSAQQLPLIKKGQVRKMYNGLGTHVKGFFDHVSLHKNITARAGNKVKGKRLIRLSLT